ncbi:hypothetical protein GTP81_09255 [Rugamonas sp. FT107W]|uniref:Uncharacterized protein n=1 Tax=Duganella vulcania TaxID=2692166 RepID=A0A845HDQ0_9BURK|nr:hypothetical protein [Duganella vulcania]MYN16940.1 hypothetical protein [Duganella vulcania]
MNGNNQPQQEQHHLAERVAHLETAIDYQSQAISELREETRADFVRVHEQLLKVRTTDFRILLSISLSTALGVVGLLIKVFGLLQAH